MKLERKAFRFEGWKLCPLPPYEKSRYAPSNEKPKLMKLFDKMRSSKEANMIVVENEIKGLVANKNVENKMLFDEKSKNLDEKPRNGKNL